MVAPLKTVDMKSKYDTRFLTLRQKSILFELWGRITQSITDRLKKHSLNCSR